MRRWLKKCREETGLTQLEISKKLDISESYFNLIENGERQKDLDLSLATKLSNILCIPIDFIVEQENMLKER